MKDVHIIYDDGSYIAMLGGGDCVESGIEGLKVTVLSEAVFSGIEGTLCFGFQ